MNKRTLLGLALLVASVGQAFADEVDFYLFKTTFNPSANHTASFKIAVRTTNFLDPNVNGWDEYPCTIDPSQPAAAYCTLSSTYKMELTSTQEEALQVLQDVYKVKAQDVKEQKLQSPGVFQFVMKDDTIYHVHLKFPSVADDSMVCTVSFVRAKSNGAISCHSEFFPESKFFVRDITMVDEGSNTIRVGVQTQHSTYENAPEEWKKQNADQLAKLQEVLRGIVTLKKINIAAESGVALDQIGSFSLNFTDSRYNDDLRVRASDEDSYDRGVESFKFSGGVQHIFRGANGESRVISSGRRGN